MQADNTLTMIQSVVTCPTLTSDNWFKETCSRLKPLYDKFNNGNPYPKDLVKIIAKYLENLEMPFILLPSADNHSQMMSFKHYNNNITEFILPDNGDELYSIELTPIIFDIDRFKEEMKLFYILFVLCLYHVCVMFVSRLDGVLIFVVYH